MGNDPIEDFFRWLEDLIKPIRQQFENFITNNPQTYVNFIERLFDFLKISIESYKPIAVQNARNYANTLIEQKKIYDSTSRYINPFYPGSWGWVSYEINIRIYWIYTLHYIRRM